MNYVESFDLFGVKAAQIPCILGVGAPVKETFGAVGCLYMNTASADGDLYKCVKASNNEYTWVKLVGVRIDDEGVSTDATWSSSKIQQAIGNAGILPATVE